jgi:hypothetical protein
MRGRPVMVQQRVLLLSAVALLLMAAGPSTVAQEQPTGDAATTAAATPAANNTVVLNSSPPAAVAAAAATPSANGTDNGTTITVSTADQPIPPFSGIRSCLPFNILLAAAQVGRLCVELAICDVLLLHARQYSSCCPCMHLHVSNMCATILHGSRRRKLQERASLFRVLLLAESALAATVCMMGQLAVCCRSMRI